MMLKTLAFLGLAGSSYAIALAPPSNVKPDLIRDAPLVAPTSTRPSLGGLVKDPAAQATVLALSWSSITAPPPSVLGVPPQPIISNKPLPLAPNFFRRPLDSTQLTKRAALPSVVDWRNYVGNNWITTAQNQQGCQSCWIFSATALVESMVRIEHGYWSKRSEEDFHDQIGVTCGQTGGPGFALDWIQSKGTGVADPQCDEYTGIDQPWLPCSDRSGRALRIPKYTSVGSVTNQKAWLASTGPLSTCFNAYQDFFTFDFSKKKAYKWDGKSTLAGGHCILIVGYDNSVGGWIVKNSYGTGWGNNGFGYIAYGTAEIDNGAKIGLVGTNPDPATKIYHRNGLFFESGNGASHRNFELFRSDKSGGIQQVFRSGDAPLNWGTAGTQAGNTPIYGQPVALGSTFNRDFHVLAVTKDGHLNEWYYSQNRPGWFFTGNIGFINYLQGYPGFVQEENADFIVVVRATGGSLLEYRRDSASGYWSYQNTLASSGIKQSGASLVRSNVNLNIYDSTTVGNLYTVAVLNDGSLQLYERLGSKLSGWRATEKFGAGVGSTGPVMIQDSWRVPNENSAGGFQLLVAVNGRVQHWQRVNTDIATNPPVAGGPGKWQLVTTFGTDILHVWGLVQGSFGLAMDAVVEDKNHNMWNWQWTNKWTLVGQVPGTPGGF